MIVINNKKVRCTPPKHVYGWERYEHIFNQEKEKRGDFEEMQLVLGLRFCGRLLAPKVELESWAEKGWRLEAGDMCLSLAKLGLTPSLALS